MRRWLIIVSIAALVAAFVTALLAPWWTPALLRRVLASRGVIFGEYETIGSTRCVLHNVSGDIEGTRFGVGTVEMDTPLVWGIRGVFSRPGDVVVRGWEVALGESKTPKPSSTAADEGFISARDELLRVRRPAARWLPVLRAENGKLTRGAQTLFVEQVTWQGERGLLQTQLRWADRRFSVELAWLERDGGLRLTAKTADGSVDLGAESIGERLTGRIHYLQQEATLTARFAPRGWLPAEANLDAPAWSLPAESLRLGPQFSAVSGKARLQWLQEKLTVELNARSVPAPDATAPPLTLVVHGSGPLTAFTLDQFHFDLPGARAHLSHPLVLGPDFRPAAATPARFEIEADLSRQPWVEAAGTLRGELLVTLAGSGMPRLQTRVSAETLRIRDYAFSRVQLDAERTGDGRLRIHTGSVTTPDGSTVTLTGEADLAQQTLLSGHAEGVVRHEAVRRWLPPEWLFSSATFSVDASGDWPELVHHGRVSVDDFTPMPARSYGVQTEWRGKGRSAEEARLVVQGGVSELAIVGSATPEEARLNQLVLSRDGTPQLQLAAPARIAWSPHIVVENVELTGPGGRLVVRGELGENARLDLLARNLHSTLFADFLPARFPAWKIASLGLAGSWTQTRPLVFSAQAKGSAPLSPTLEAGIELAAEANDDGLTVSGLHVTEGTTRVLQANGRMPLTFWPRRGEWWQLNRDASWQAVANTAPEAAFWQKLAEATGLQLVSPALAARLGGTPTKPEATVDLRADRILLDPARWPQRWPELGSLSGQLRSDGRRVTLDAFSVRIAGQLVNGGGTLDIPAGEWRSLADAETWLKSNYNLRLQVPEFDLAALGDAAPVWLAPRGKLAINVDAAEGGKLQGRVTLRDAGTRPLGNIGAVNDINADLALTDRRVTILSASATASGQPLAIAGSMELPARGKPKVDVSLRGENLPFVRRPGLLVRGDLDLRTVTNDEGVTRITGTVNLRDSLFLSDVRAFWAQGGSGSRADRPPFFAIEAAPFNAWQLDVELRGERFLRLRTTAFNGRMSTRFRLGGTLGEPRAVGEATIDEGQVLFPFATFTVQSGSLRLTQADPYTPQLSLVGTARDLGYDLRMEVSGTADAPNLVFTSTPPLASEQVLLLVMAGEAPRDEVAYSTEQRAVRLSTYLGKSFLEELLGISSGEGRLTFSSGEKTTRQGRETYLFEYRLNDRWSAVGEYDEFDDYNAGLKWRVFTGRPKKK
jgi:translocation and assembly module TamB